jgi:dedicator of cytokinesis protein 3
MYVRYVYKLYNIHVACGNHTEAAKTLLLHAELLEWNDDPLLSPDSSAEHGLKWQTKENIYLKIIEEFDKGKVRRVALLCICG